MTIINHEKRNRAAKVKRGAFAIKHERWDIFEVTCPRCGHTGTIRTEQVSAARLRCRRCGWRDHP